MNDKKLGLTTRTERGFEILKFEDCYGMECSMDSRSLPARSQAWRQGVLYS